MESEIARLKSLRFFISYTIATRELVGQLKKHLELNGFDVFCAHEDIRPATEWQDDILRNLDMADVFIAVLTSDFKESDWTDQETGVAVAGNKFIIPIQIDMSPYGFINKYQSLKLRTDVSNGLEIATGEIIDAMILRSKFKADMKSFFINVLAESNSFDQAKIRARVVCNKFNDFSKGDINRIYTATMENNQIYGSFGAQDALLSLFKRHQDKLSLEEFGSVTERFK